MNPLKSHPQASTAAGASGIGFLVVWALNRYVDAGLDAEDGALVAGATVTFVLFIGREGIRGAVRRLWSGEARETTTVAVEVSKVGDERPQVEVTTTGTESATKTPTRKPATKKSEARRPTGKSKGAGSR